MGNKRIGLTDDVRAVILVALPSYVMRRASVWSASRLPQPVSWRESEPSVLGLVVWSMPDGSDARPFALLHVCSSSPWGNLPVRTVIYHEVSANCECISLN